jgi:AhpD family alkylhydroperoxidase
MSNAESLCPKGKELVAVGAAIAAGCMPCTAYHVEGAHEVGATDDEIRRAVEVALRIRDNATLTMAALADEILDEGPEASAPEYAAHDLIDALVGAGAALAINCPPILDTQIADARRLGAADRKIQTALAMARLVKREAAKEINNHAATLFGTPDPEPVTHEGDGCSA